MKSELFFKLRKPRKIITVFAGILGLILLILGYENWIVKLCVWICMINFIIDTINDIKTYRNEKKDESKI
jgi:hypothetical protein